jgi:hypothetical protein
VSNTFVKASQPERLFLKNAAAYSNEGHALYARQLAEFLLQQLPGAAPASPEYSPPQPQARLGRR